MNMKLSTNRNLKRMFANILSIFVILALAFPAIGSVYAQDELIPFFRAFPDGNAVDGGNWPLGATVHMAIDDPATDVDPDYEDDATVVASEEGWISTYVRFDFDGAYDLKRGDKVTLTAGEISRYQVVPNLWVATLDVENNIVAGTFEGAEVGTTVHVFIGGGAELYVSTDSEGAWVADFGGIGFNLLPGMEGAVEVWFDEFGDSTIFNWVLPLPSPWRDEFDGPLAEPWYWINENADKWSFNDGFLRIYASPYGTGGENLLLRPVAVGDFMIKTRVLFEPDTNFQFAGLVIWQDEENFLQLGRAFCDLEDACVGNGIYFDKILNGNFTDGNFGTPIGNPSDVYLRLERRGDMVRGFYSMDGGMTWYEIGTHWIPSDFQVNGVGLTAPGDYNTPDWDIPADFDFFELTEGWGFLPEGFHDFDSGDVPSWACNAGGWAADPDDREADVNIEVVVDHQTAANLVAGEFRQDLLDAGVCVDGNCSFSTSLWGVISSYEPHRVDAWAQDTTRGDWVLLSNSAKTLTCRTYDIYTFDPAAETTVQITNLQDMHEFNPRWSPDAKKIVHDAWNTDWSSHGIYITDVKTGVSTPLSGAEGGSYPTWSPSGKWIAFDRGADNDYRLFIVPPTGGVPKLVRDDAFMATWAPNSQRLAFHQPSDGSIRTTNLNGGSVTMVSERGNGPAWSPDGEWIAFEVDGDIWKVRVNNNGAPLGNPIQLTSSPFWEGRPTWSFNSKIIAFHAGMGQDTDIWTIPAAGGEATWLTGAPNFGDYDANYSLKGQSAYISYSSFSPDGQAARSWVAAYTYDPPAGTFSEGTHPYYFDFEWSVPESGSWSGQGGDFVISDGAEVYDGYVLLRGPEEIHGINYPHGLACEPVGDINSSQLTRFLIGWLPDYGEISYTDAKAHFESITATAVWDDGSAELARHEIIPFRWDNWFDYVCTFTETPPKMDLRVNYGHDWVESFYEGGHTVGVTVTDADGNVKATSELMTEPKDYWGGETGFQSLDGVWFDGDGNQMEYPPDLQPYDWVYAQVDNGATAQVQLGDIQGEVRFDLDSVTGTISVPWITDAVQVECLDWGSGAGPFNKDAGTIYTNGVDPYSCTWDPETEWDVQPWQDIGVGYSTPDGHWVANAFRDERWMAVWTYDPPTGSLQEGDHSYYYDLAYTVPEYVDYPPMDPRTFTVSGDTPIYAGYALLGPWDYMPVRVWNGSACEVVSVLNPDQPIRFISGWVNDYSMTYDEALAHFNSLTVDLSWDGEAIDSASFTMSELFPFYSRDARIEYICTFTDHP